MALYQATNENVVAGFETTEDGEGVQIVTKAAPILHKLIFGKRLAHAIISLTDRGYDVEVVK